MSLESGILGAFFNVDNWAKDILVNNLNYPSVKEVNDIMYCEENPAVMKADLLWAPDNKKYDKYPVILNIHGGGFVFQRFGLGLDAVVDPPQGDQRRHREYNKRDQHDLQYVRCGTHLYFHVLPRNLFFCHGIHLCAVANTADNTYTLL